MKEIIKPSEKYLMSFRSVVNDIFEDLMALFIKLFKTFRNIVLSQVLFC